MSKQMGSRALTALLLAPLACAAPAPDGNAEQGGGQQVTQPVVPLECQPSERMAVEGRASPYDSATIRVGGQEAKICYGRPAARDRQVFGGLVPYGELWRTGANEPTIIHLPFTADMAGLTVPPGSYSIYTIPQEGDWTLIVNRSISQWGHPSSYTEEVEAQELGRTTIRTERLDQHVEMFTIGSQATADGADILLDWERTRARIPVRVVASGGT